MTNANNTNDSNDNNVIGKTVTLKQAAQLILACPENRYLLRGEPGIGKSSVLKYLGKQLPTHSLAYIDVPNMDLGDIAMPVIDHDTRTTKYYPNARFQLHEGKPAVIMLDELTKGSEPVKNMLHPLFEKVNPRLGDVPVPPETIVFMTGNLSSDNVGDHIKAHTMSRIVPITVRKPSADEWLEWAMDNGIAAEICAWVKQSPEVLASYTDGDGDNPFIYNPKRVQDGYVTPRSLETASNIVRNRSKLDVNTLTAALAGAIGEAGARALEAFINYSDQLPTWESVMSNPNTAPIPEDPGACAVVVFNAIHKVDKNSIDNIMTYIDRFEPEWSACFCITLAKNPARQAVAFANKSFAQWVTRNQDIL